MAEIIKPDMSDLWAAGGASISPPAPKINLGWTAEIPPHQWQNWWQNRSDRAMSYIYQHGIPEWDLNTEYFAGRSFVQYNGNLYTAVLNSTNQIPAANPTYWSLTVPGAATTTSPGVVQLATSAETITGTNATKAVTPAGLASKVATSGAIGLVQLATQAEVNTGTETSKVVTPATLAGKVASSTGRGIIQLATQAEVNLGADTLKAVTPSTLRFGFAMAQSVNNGYLTLPSWLGGFIFQWGRGSIPLTNNVNPAYYTGTLAITLPINFPNQIAIVLPSIQNTPNALDTVAVSGLSTSSISLIGCTSNESQQTPQAYWLAIGW